MSSPGVRPPLSERASAFLDAGGRIEYIAEHEARMNGSTPDSEYVSLAIAENKLMWDVLDRKVNAPRAVPPSAMGYDDWQGSRSLRNALSGFLGKRLHGVAIDPADIQIMSGAGPLVESLSWAVCNPGDGVLIPTPSYAGYWFDIGGRTRVVPVPAHTSSHDHFRITPEALSAAEAASEVPIRMLLLTNPSNPLGRVLTDEEIHAAIGWARERGIHVIFNEIYGLSIYGETPFHSAASLGYIGQDDVHLLWAFSKDFSASGLRCGVMVTTNGDVRQAVGGFGYFHGVSGDTQHLLATMISDDVWVDDYLTKLRVRLATASDKARGILEEAGIGTIESGAGIFFLADMRSVMSEVTWEAEHELWRRILDTMDVNLTPGSACHNGEPGFVRVCFAAQPVDVMEAALKRVVAALA